MNVLYALLLVLIASNAYCYVIEDRKSGTNDDEKKIVVQSLAKYFGKEQSRSNFEEDESNDDDTLNASEEDKDSVVVDKPAKSFEYKPNKFVYPSDVSPDAKPPMAVPPTDFRYYLNDFNVPPTSKDANLPMALQLNDNPGPEQSRKSQSSISRDDDVVVDRVLPKSNYYSFFLLGHGPPLNSNITNFKESEIIGALIWGVTCVIFIIVLITIVFTFRNVKKKILDAEEVDYPAYGVTGPNKDTPAPTGDRNLAHSAQMYHFHHQKSQIIAMEKESKPSITRKGTESGSEEDEAVYECPGLAPVTGEMEVNNPLFHEEEVKSSNVSKEEKEKKIHSEEKKKSKK